MHGRAGLRVDPAGELSGRGVSLSSTWLGPQWPGAGVGALMTSRVGGVSVGPFASMNLGTGIGDTDASVATNRARFAEACGAAPVFLRQVHGRRVVRLAEADVAAPAHEADASVTTSRGVACTVLVADCLPVLFTAPAGRAVGAAHAGWRGLAAGVIEATVEAVCEAGRCRPGELRAWLGACIGPRRFEVGADVLDAFAAGPQPAGGAAFVVEQPGKWLADLAALARARLAGVGVADVSGADRCTVEDASRFFSFRRDRVTGRMAAAVWIAADRG